jgi:hypothetical protein
MKKIITFLVVFLISHLTFAQTPWDGVTITPVTPDAKWNYTVTSAAELAWIAQECNNGNNFNARLILITDDIDLNNKPWTPIGRKDAPFKGTFEGNWKIIKNINVVDTDYVGLFGYIEGRDYKTLYEISNLFVENVNITGQNYVGGIVGFAKYYVFDSCYVVLELLKGIIMWVVLLDMPLLQQLKTVMQKYL